MRITTRFGLAAIMAVFVAASSGVLLADEPLPFYENFDGFPTPTNFFNNGIAYGTTYNWSAADNGDDIVTVVTTNGQKQLFIEKGQVTKDVNSGSSERVQVYMEVTAVPGEGVNLDDDNETQFAVFVDADGQLNAWRKNADSAVKEWVTLTHTPIADGDSFKLRVTMLYRHDDPADSVYYTVELVEGGAFGLLTADGNYTDDGEEVGSPTTTDGEGPWFLSALEVAANHYLKSITFEGDGTLIGQLGANEDPLDPTLAVISAVRSRINVDGQAEISWEVILELGTEGYYLERLVGDEWVRVNDILIPAVGIDPDTGEPAVYAQVDAAAPIATVQTYRIVELDIYDNLNPSRAYTLALDGGEISYATWAEGIDWGDHDSDPNADPDGDGLTNFEEYLAGTDPLDATSTLRVISLVVHPDGVYLTWESVEGQSYKVMVSATVEGPFLALEPAIVGEAGGQTTVLIPVDPELLSGAFFKVVVVPYAMQE